MILLTRPKDSAVHTKYVFEERGFEVFCEPVLTISYVNRPFKEHEKAHHITTSAAGIRALARLTPNRHMPLWCVGKQSKAVAQDLGFQSVFCPQEGENALSLFEAITETVPQQTPLVYVHGSHLSVDLKSLFMEKGYAIFTYEAYKTKPSVELSEECLHLFHQKRIQAVTLYSEETARIFIRLVEFYGLESLLEHCVALCLSPKIKDMVVQKGWKLQILVAQSTEDLAANYSRFIAK